MVLASSHIMPCAACIHDSIEMDEKNLVAVTYTHLHLENHVEMHFEYQFVTFPNCGSKPWTTESECLWV
jgi:hypothetical protein